ncbi:MAG: hypothetical protein Q8S18_07790 [Bacteroidales bacterium]|nr:hypothetical protein [Bacteroidales bacterium]
MKTSQKSGVVTYSLITGILLLVTLTILLGSRESILPIALVVLIQLIALAMFYQITVTVDDQQLMFTMGIGLIKRTYPLNQIESCKAVRNRWWYGWGIRYFPGGILFNVTGLDAIELKLKKKRSVVRIGTKIPQELSDFVNAKINTSTP